MSNLKKCIALFLTLVMVLAFTACGGNTEKPDASEEPSTSGVAAGDETIKLSLSVCSYASSSAFYAGMEEFATKVNEYSNGTISCDIYTDASLGDETSQVAALADGSIDMLVAGDSYFAPYYAGISAFELPFLFESEAEARHVLDSAPGDYVKEQFAGSDINILGFWEVGMRQFGSNGKLVSSIDDVKGMRLRVLPVDIQIYAWELFGAQVTPIDGSELFSALQTGVVYAMENPLEGIWANRLYEVIEYISLTNHSFTPAAVGFSQITWDKLSTDQQDAVVKAFSEATQVFRDLADSGTAEALENLKNASQIKEINESPDVSGFVELADQVYDEFYKSVPEAEELVDLIYTARDEFRAE